MDKRKSRQWPWAYGDDSMEMCLSISLCCRWCGEVEGCEVGNRARTTTGMLLWDQKLPTCPERWPSAAGSHALSSGFPVQCAGMGEGAEKSMGPPLLPLLPVLSWD